MNEPSAEALSVVVEREIPHPPEKIWRAITQPHLIGEWLMKNDFKPAVGHRFNLRGDWGGVLDCEVLVVEQNAVLHLEFCARRCGLQSVRPIKFERKCPLLTKSGHWPVAHPCLRSNRAAFSKYYIHPSTLVWDGARCVAGDITAVGVVTSSMANGSPHD
jgi:Activator of Hsp90 ATPase homolog 1-like protein